MQETTGLCPFLETCETHQELKRTQTRLIKEKRESLSETPSLERWEINTIIVSFQRKFVKLRRLEARCTSFYGWCHRFWQNLRFEKEEHMMGQQDNIRINEATTG
jgi:hypothetical protein